MEVTSETFLQNIQEIQQLSDKIYDTWRLCNEKSFYTENSTYLKKTIHKVSKLDDKALLTFEYHIVFDAMYSVPKLCFITFRTDGSHLTLNDCLAQFDFAKDDNILQILTQMDHPVLQRPFYCLHPCKTADLMQQVASCSKNVVVTWLSTIGPSVGLTLDNDYSSLT